MAYTDPMTGLPNRAGFLRLVAREAGPYGGGATLLMIELDGLAAARGSSRARDRLDGGGRDRSAVAGHRAR